jgi:hypothetical protein
MKELSTIAAARISNIARLVYSIYQHGPHFTLRRIELNGASERSHGRMARWRVWRILFCFGWNWGTSANNLLVLRQDGLPDHVPRFSVDRKRNIALTALAFCPVRKSYEKASGTFDNSDVIDHKAIVEADGSISFDEFLFG